MFRGFYTAGSGMIAQQRRTEVLANNLANARTPGFKEEQSTIRSFPDMLLSQVEAGKLPTDRNFQFRTGRPVGTVSTGVYMQETLPNFAPGSLIESGLPTDVALVDTGIVPNAETGEVGTFLFRIETEDGEQRYTRNGSFMVGPNDFLLTNRGEYVLDYQGERIEVGNDEFTVTPDGVIEPMNQRLSIAFVADVNDLLKVEEGVYAHRNGEALPEVEQGEANQMFEVRQGYVEGSNVDVAQTMTGMMSSYRAFEANSKILQAYDRSMEKAVELGRLT